MGSKAPDTSGQNQAALMSAQLSKEQLDWAKTIYAETAPDRAAATERANAVSDAQLSSMGLQDAIAKDYQSYQTDTFRPLEKGIVADAQTFDTPERRASEAAAASADVERNIGLQRAASSREMERAGVNPSSGKALGLQTAIDLGAAKAKAGAASQAARAVEVQGYARKMDAANLGRGLASAQATSAGLALNAGNASVGNAGAAVNASTSGANLMNAGFSGAQASLNSSANIYGAIASQQQTANNSAWGNIAAGVGAAAKLGSAWIAASDKNIKTDIRSVDPKHSLAAIVAMDAKSWRYKRGSSADDGGKKHTGPMAQDVKRTLGDAVAPGGKGIDLISMNGHTMGAIKELDRKIHKLEDAIKKSGTRASDKATPGAGLADAPSLPSKPKSASEKAPREYRLADAVRKR